MKLIIPINGSGSIECKCTANAKCLVCRARWELERAASVFRKAGAEDVARGLDVIVAAVNSRVRLRRV